MLIMDFNCKEFSLNHKESTMKVGTDAILLSSLAPRMEAKNILDVGCGCGIISLCMAQTYPYAKIIAIDIDEKSIIEAKSNFFSSKYKDRLQADLISFQDFRQQTTLKESNPKTFDLIISNPPYFTSSLASPNDRKTKARHNDSLPLDDFAICCESLIDEHSKIMVILPKNEADTLEDIFNKKNIYVEKQYQIFSSPKTECKRIVNIFQSEPKNKQIERIFIRDIDGNYTKEYEQLTKKFLL
jgi:tRNA1Val (adenine37-N6)-methyltransferase